jgi:hypothetical protein
MLYGINGREALPYTINLDVNTQTIIAGAEEIIANYWSIVLAEAGNLEVTFAENDIPALDIVINDFTVDHMGAGVSHSGIFSFSNLAVGDVLTFKVTGTATPGGPALSAGGSVGGVYSVTTDFSAVPVPAAVWFMGTAMLGLLTVGRRKGA